MLREQVPQIFPSPGQSNDDPNHNQGAESSVVDSETVENIPLIRTFHINGEHPALEEVIWRDMMRRGWSGEEIAAECKRLCDEGLRSYTFSRERFKSRPTILSTHWNTRFALFSVLVIGAQMAQCYLSDQDETDEVGVVEWLSSLD